MELPRLHVPIMLSHLARLSPLARFIVEGESMAPAYRPGERLIVNKLAYVARAPRPGDVVVLRDPRQPSRHLLKRIVQVQNGGCWVLGDNPAASTDSRHFGPVPRTAIIGQVLCRY